jgi:hypothetical protein
MEITLTTPEGDKIKVNPNDLIKRTPKGEGINSFTLRQGGSVHVMETWTEINALMKGEEPAPQEEPEEDLDHDDEEEDYHQDDDDLN